MNPAPAESEDAAFFRDQMRDVAPVRSANRVEPWRSPREPVAAKRHADDQAVLAELAKLARGAAAEGADEAEIEEDTAFLRPGLPRDILRKLRRTHWAIQADLDLHGLSSEQAAIATAQFLTACRRRGLRCVRIVHGKGLRSRGREPILKRLVRRMLMRRDEVLAFVEPRAHQGGSGAVVVLLHV